MSLLDNLTEALGLNIVVCVWGCKCFFYFLKLRTSLFSNRQVKPETRQQELKPRGCTRQKNESGKQSSERKTRRRQKERAGKKEKQKKREKIKAKDIVGDVHAW